MKPEEKFEALVDSESSTWLHDAAHRADKSGSRKNARKVALNVLQALEEKSMTQTSLAELMGVSRQQVSKIVKGEENFTFETIDKLEKALGIQLINTDLNISKSSRKITIEIMDTLAVENFICQHITFKRFISPYNLLRAWNSFNMPQMKNNFCLDKSHIHVLHRSYACNRINDHHVFQKNVLMPSIKSLDEKYYTIITSSEKSNKNYQELSQTS